MRIFKKLIRDKMPEIMAAQGKPLKTRVIEDTDEYISALENKLLEELQELRQQENPPLVQIAYMLEIIEYLQQAYGLTSEEVQAEKQHKHEERGGFDKRLFLEGEQ